MELPDFHLPHADKIEWMIETFGWAVEPVPANPDAQPPQGPFSYTIGLPALVGCAEVAVWGLTPSASKGLIDLVVATCQAGTQIPHQAEIVGLLDNDLRCYLAPIDPEVVRGKCRTAVAWYHSQGAEIEHEIEMVQLIYPDRNGFMPYEAGFDQRMRFAQPIIGNVDFSG
jgi:hypothetical protein